MKKITLFTLSDCPYCHEALRWMEELTEEYPEYAEIPVEIIDEREHPEIADAYDYYYVPTFYVSGEKLHEGVASKDKIHRVLERALRA